MLLGGFGGEGRLISDDSPVDFDSFDKTLCPIEFSNGENLVRRTVCLFLLFAEPEIIGGLVKWEAGFIGA